MGIVAAVRERLDEGRVQVVPSTMDDAPPGSMTVRDLICEAIGVHRRAGPLAYVEQGALRHSLRGVSALLSATAEAEIHMWAADPSRSHDEVVALFGRVEGDTALPAPPTLRPWCDPGEVRTCRIPFVPLAAAVHAMVATGTTVRELVADHRLAACDPWQMLDQLDPLAAGCEPPSVVRDAAMALRAQMFASEPAVHSPGRFLSHLAVRHPDARPADLVALPASTTSDEAV